ncbi:TPA: winged helix-turn-helix domain-containing protein [Salmonella enterica]
MLFIGDANDVIPFREDFKKNGFDIDLLSTCTEAERALLLIPYEAVIISFLHTKNDVVNVISRWRKNGINIPMLVLIGNFEEVFLIKILDSGADDCIKKTVPVSEIISRLRAIIRRRYAVSSCLLRYRDIEFDTGSLRVTFRGKKVKMTYRELSLLELFLLNKNRVLRRAYLEANLNTWCRETCSNTVEVHISHLRKKLEPNIIQTIRGVGYRLNPNI